MRRRIHTRAIFVLTVIAAVLGAAMFSTTATAAAKKGKVHVCVEKRGKDKGAMRLAKTKHCHKGEKSLTLNKRGKRGKRGHTGEAGPQGPAGEGASPDAIAALQEALAAQAAQLAALQSQLAAACAQLTAVTDQFGALQPFFDALALLPAIPDPPPGLPAFSCV